MWMNHLNKKVFMQLQYYIMDVIWNK